MSIDYIKHQIINLCNYKDLNHIAQSLTEQDKMLIMRHANDLMKNTFTFDKPWDMERCITPYHLEKIDWEMDANGDEEWCFMLNRMDYLNYLMYASLIQNDNSFQKKGKEYLFDWISQHTEIVPKRSTRTLDTGIRMMNLFEALPYLYNSSLLNDEELAIIAESLMKQMEYMKNHYLLKYITSNWGSIQTCAIVSVLPYLDEQYAENELYQWALQELEVQMEAQVYPDGMHWEQSTMYHIEVLNYGMKALYYMNHRGIKVPALIYQAVYRLADALFYQATPAKEIETFGDSDRSNIQDVFCRAAVLFKEPRFKFLGFDSFDCESLYTLGNRENESYQKMEIICPDKNVYDGNDAGMYTIKSGWKENDSFTMFTNGSLGSGHGHSDNLHISIYHKGAPLLIDAGRLTYREDDMRRMQLKGMKAHNTVLIDEHEFCVPSDAWGYRDFGRPFKNYVRHVDNLHYLEGTFAGHEPLSLVTRKVVIIDPSIWFICDEISCDGEHIASQRFHMDAGVSFSQQERMIFADDLHTKMIFSDPITVSDDLCSIRYNEPLTNQTIKSQIVFQDFGLSNVAICDTSIEVEKADVFQEKSLPISNDFATAVSFRMSNEEKYTIVIFHKEVYIGKKIIFCEDMPFHAKCVVIHEKQGRKTLTKLKM